MFQNYPIKLTILQNQEQKKCHNPSCQHPTLSNFMNTLSHEHNVTESERHFSSQSITLHSITGKHKVLIQQLPYTHVLHH